jgi:formylglycine-generating enzyme required for sulfatase activity
MKNLLLKNNLISKGRTSEMFVNIPNRGNLEYDYQFTKVLSQDRINYNESYFKHLTVFDYKGIKFNMITCPAGGKVNIEEWGLQEIKEPFMLGETEVTQELFEAVMGFNYSNSLAFNFSGSPVNKNPVEKVTWFDCLEFCNRLSIYFGLKRCYLLQDDDEYKKNLSISNATITFISGANGFRLPKEWEWQIAAMAGTNNKYAGANDDESVKRVAWFYRKHGKTHPVAQKLPNEWGLYDMSGNVYEWCENSKNPNENNNSKAERTYRGGSYLDTTLMTSAFRGHESPGELHEFLGFRVVKSI